MLKKPEDKKQLGDFFGMSNSYAECYPATYVRLTLLREAGGIGQQVWVGAGGWGKGKFDLLGSMDTSNLDELFC